MLEKLISIILPGLPVGVVNCDAYDSFSEAVTDIDTKEMTLVMLAVLFGTTNFASVMSPVQMLVFAFVTMLYIPCAATIAALVKETGWKRGMFITVFNIIFAVAAGGLFFRVLSIFM